MSNKKNKIMCVKTGIWQNTEISFMTEHVFCEHGQYIVNHPRNTDGFNNKTVPNKIALSAISMVEGAKAEIISRIQREKQKKTAAKEKRHKMI